MHHCTWTVRDPVGQAMQAVILRKSGGALMMPFAHTTLLVTYASLYLRQLTKEDTTYHFLKGLPLTLDSLIGHTSTWLAAPLYLHMKTSWCLTGAAVAPRYLLRTTT
jgi:hypothetical protein